MTPPRFKLLVRDAGAYEAPTRAALAVRIFGHRLWHLLRGDGWID